MKGFSSLAPALVLLLAAASGIPGSPGSPLAAQAAPPAAPAGGSANLSPAALYQFSLAKLLAVEGSLPESLAAYDEAERLAPGSAYVRLEHAQLLARVAQYTRADKPRLELQQHAAAAIADAQRLAPENLDVLKAVGSIYLDLSAQDPSALPTAQRALETVRRMDPADAPSMVTLGQLYLDQRQPEKAAEVLRDLVTRVPQQRMAYALLVEALMRSGKEKEAESALQDILGIDPGSIEARVTLADMRSQRGDHRAALETLRAAPEEVRAEPRLQRQIAWELYQSGDLPAALAAAEALLASPAGTGADGDSMRLLKGLLLAAEGRTDEAIGLLDEVRTADPTNVALGVTVAQLEQRAGHKEKAAELLTRLTADLAKAGKAKEERAVRLQLGQLLLDAKDYEGLTRVLAPVLAAQGEDAEASRAEALRLEIDALVAAKRWDDALALIDQKGGRSAAMQARRAEVLLRSGREAEGRKALQDLAGTSDVATLTAAQSFQRAERFADSVPVLERFLARQPDSVLGHYLLASGYERTGKRGQAIAELRRVLQIDPDFHAALNYLGYTLAEGRENLDEALALVQRAVAMEPDNGAYVDSLGWTYYQLGRHEQARGYLERAARLEPADATLQEHLGDVYVALGQNDRARQAYNRALELGDDNAESVRHKLDNLDNLDKNGAKPRPQP